LIINLSNVTKKYKTKQKVENSSHFLRGLFSKKHSYLTAINNLDMSIESGEMVGYLGVNGAGKSTTIKMLTGILVPTEGYLSILGKDPYKNRTEISRKIGVVFGQRSQLIWDIPPIDTFNLFSKIYEIPKKQYLNTLEYIVTHMKMKDFLSVPVRKLSLGQRMCCEITACLLHNPQILLLDEPTIGLDILNKERVREFVKSLNKEHNTTIMLTTHDLGDVEKLCSRIVIIDKGAKIYDGSLQSIKEKYGMINKIKVDFASKLDLTNLKINNVTIEEDYAANCIFVKYNKNEHKTANLINLIINLNDDIKDISVIETGFEDILKDFFNNNTN